LPLQTAVRVIRIEKNIARPGSTTRFNRVLFELQTDSFSCSSFSVWVSRAYNDAHIERVARRVLGMELERLSMAAVRDSARADGSTFQTRSRGHSLGRKGKRRYPDADLRRTFRILRYILKGQCSYPCDDLEVWKAHLQMPTRWVGNTDLVDAQNRSVRICTVFLGLDMSFGMGTPVLFETVVLGGTRDREVYRYTSWDEAQKGHAAIAQLIQSESGTRVVPTEPVAMARDLAQQTLALAQRLAESGLLENGS
jgi:hypothetical protein